MYEFYSTKPILFVFQAGDRWHPIISFLKVRLLPSSSWYFQNQYLHIQFYNGRRKLSFLEWDHKPYLLNWHANQSYQLFTLLLKEGLTNITVLWINLSLAVSSFRPYSVSTCTPSLGTPKLPITYGVLSGNFCYLFTARHFYHIFFLSE